ncbi:MAG: c-type cytochrome [Kofleriaceae bacterium]
MRIFCVLLTLIFACARPPAPPSPPQPAAVVVVETRAPQPSPQAEQLKRGAYVVEVAGCKVCHTPVTEGVGNGPRPFAGGVEGLLPAGGIWRTPNITPDRETGIGQWTDEQIIRAIRMGIHADGTKLLPLMPYPYYHRMTDSDALAVVAFLRRQRPIYNKVDRSTGITLPPVDLPPPTGNVDRVDDMVLHGEYLATLAHCGACHTPMTGDYAGQLFAGGVAFELPDGRTIFSANITSDPETGVGSWTEGQLVDTLRTMRTPHGNAIEGPMATYQTAWSQLTERDLHAIAAYVKSVAPIVHDVDEPPPAVTLAP